MKLKKIKTFQINYKSIGVIAAWSLSVIGLFITLGFVGKEKSTIRCKSVNIHIDDETGNEFITKKDVLDLLNSKEKQPLGKLMNDINIGMLEKLVNSNSYVANAEVYSTINGELNIDIRQRNPIIRIINNKYEHFYIDEKGEYMPVSLNYSAPVIVANGNITDAYADRKINNYVDVITDTVIEKPLINGLFELALYINKHQFWNAQIEQIYVNDSGEIELIPRVGNQVIIFGDVSQIEEKFKKLMIFYKQGMNKTGWNDYSTINLKYKDQVVCTKQQLNNNIKLAKQN